MIQGAASGTLLAAFSISTVLYSFFCNNLKSWFNIKVKLSGTRIISFSVTGSILWSFCIKVNVYMIVMVSSVGIVVHGISQMKW